MSYFNVSREGYPVQVRGTLEDAMDTMVALLGCEDCSDPVFTIAQSCQKFNKGRIVYVFEWQKKIVKIFPCLL